MFADGTIPWLLIRVSNAVNLQQVAPDSLNPNRASNYTAEDLKSIKSRLQSIRQQIQAEFTRINANRQGANLAVNVNLAVHNKANNYLWQVLHKV